MQYSVTGAKGAPWTTHTELPRPRQSVSRAAWLCPKNPSLTQNRHISPKFAETAKLERRTKPGLFLASVRHQHQLGYLRVVCRQAEHVVRETPEDRFVLISRISLSSGADPQWAPDGNKLACVQQLASGVQLAIIDIQQPRAFTIPMSADFRLNQSRLIAWSPGSEQLYFLNSEGNSGSETALLAVDVRSGALRELARGKSSALARLPQISPDGARLFWGPPENKVFSARTGDSIWILPPGAQALWSPWSRDSLELYFQREDDPSVVFAHNFESSSDTALISGVSGNGVFDSDGGSYFYWESSLPTGSSEAGRGEFRTNTPGWRQADRGTPSRALAGIEIWPWEKTLDGLILARRDDSTRVRYGLYDPETRRLEPYTFPTDGEDLLRQVKSYRLVIATVALFALLAIVVLAKRPETKSGRAFPPALVSHHCTRLWQRPWKFGFKRKSCTSIPDYP